MAQHSLNLNWNYPEVSGAGELWHSCADVFASDYDKLCALFGTKPHSKAIPRLEQHDPKSIQIDAASADSLFHIPDNSVDAVITDPPYYSTIQYAELSDFFYVWMKRTLGDIFPELFYLELTDKDREAVANPSRFRNMGVSADELANQDYEAKMALAFGGFNLTELAKTHKLLDSTSGTCQLLTPQQRLKKKAFSVNEQEFSCRFLIDGLHAILAIYQEEQNIPLVRRFMKNTGLVSNDMFMKTMEVAFKVIPDSVPEHKALLDLWLAMDEIQAKVVVEQMELPLNYGQLDLDFNNN